MQQVLCINCDCKSCADFRRNNYQQMGGATHGARAEADQITRDISHTSQHCRLPFDCEYWHRRFRRGSLDTAINEAGEHEIANA